MISCPHQLYFELLTKITIKIPKIFLFRETPKNMNSRVETFEVNKFSQRFAQTQIDGE